MLARFLPKEFNFFDLFDKQAECAVDAAQGFKDLVSRGTLNPAALQKIRDIEHKGDDVTRDIISQLNKSFITPFDREDIHALAKEMDDVIDMIHSIVNRLRVYKLSGVDKNLVDFATVIEQSIHSMSGAVRGLRKMKNTKEILDHCLEVNRLENVGDSMRDTMIGELFEHAKDPIHAIKWKEIYQDAETVLDICEDVAHIVESILVKQA